MSSVSRIIPNFWNGISQQAPALRREGQAESQANAHGDIVYGLRKRPGTAHIAALVASAAIGGIGCRSFVFEVQGVGDFLVIATNDATFPLEIYNLATGAQQTLSYGAGAVTYLTTNYASVPASTRIKMLQLGLKAFLLNTTVVATCGGSAPGSLTGSVQQFSALPISPPVGVIYRIAGTDATKFSTSYVKYSTVWDEHWNEAESPDTPQSTTMPFELSYSGGVFSVTQASWKGRTAGDSNTNPAPSFDGKAITEMFFSRGRFGLIGGSSVVFSQTADYYNFLATSVVDILDDDPIDIAVSLDSLDTLRHAVSYDKNLLVFGDRTQFAVGSGESTVLTSRTISATPTTRFEIEASSAPFSAGPNVYFATRGISHLAIREYYIESGSLQQDAADVTAHVPKFIPAGSCILQGINVEDILFVRSEASPNVLQVYKYYWIKDEKAQSSWSSWTFGGDIAAMTAYKKKLYLVVKYGTTLMLEVIDMEFPNNVGLGVHLHMDRVTAPVSKTFSGGKTTFAFGFDVEIAGETAVYLINATDGVVYDKADMTDEAAGDFSIPGDLSGKTCFFGRGYAMEYQLSEFFMVDRDSGAPMLQSRLQLRCLRLEYKDTGYFQVRVEGVGRDVKEIEEYDATANLDSLADWSTINLASGEGRFPIFLNSKEAEITIINDTILPVQIVAGVMEVYYTERSKLV